MELVYRRKRIEKPETSQDRAKRYARGGGGGKERSGRIHVGFSELREGSSHVPWALRAIDSMYRKQHPSKVCVVANGLKEVL
ncbi:hypothetical protein OPV22_014231 [Ensete ventricosum]|uniref:Uncharacterized protein n=1 Tax=Ensete ventricosum TaxID=4639 RepID=A0AAV8R163_ENSVE|nr:hypothetical protein OPV22_014231 [Ensete ventricosum]